MYENGRRLNRHRRQYLHKRKMKERYARKYFCYGGYRDWNEMLIMYREQDPDMKWNPLDYWREWYKGDYTKFMEKQARRRTRRALKREMMEDDWDNVPTHSKTPGRAW